MSKTQNSERTSRRHLSLTSSGNNSPRGTNPPGRSERNANGHNSNAHNSNALGKVDQKQATSKNEQAQEGVKILVDPKKIVDKKSADTKKADEKNVDQKATNGNKNAVAAITGKSLKTTDSPKVDEKAESQKVDEKSQQNGSKNVIPINTTKSPNAKDSSHNAEEKNETPKAAQKQEEVVVISDDDSFQNQEGKVAQTSIDSGVNELPTSASAEKINLSPAPNDIMPSVSARPAVHPKASTPKSPKAADAELISPILDDATAEKMPNVEPPIEKGALLHSSPLKPFADNRSQSLGSTISRCSTTTENECKPIGTGDNDVVMDASPIKKSPIKSYFVSQLANLSTVFVTGTPANNIDTTTTYSSDFSSPSTSTLNRNNQPGSSLRISARRNIHHVDDFKYRGPANYRDTYRRINTELDSSAVSNSSMNVTVGSEIGNDTSIFSFFRRSRKRDRTPNQPQSSMQLQTDGEDSPPKRARIEKQGRLKSFMSSPLASLRWRFSAASVEDNSTPKNVSSTEDDEDVQNLSGISIEEELPNDIQDPGVEKPVSEDCETNNESKESNGDNTLKGKADLEGKENIADDVDGDIHIVEKPIGPDAAALAKNKRCCIM